MWIKTLEVLYSRLSRFQLGIPFCQRVAMAMNMAHIRDTKWLTLEVCREFQRGTCSRSDQECKFAHPAKSCQVDNGRVIACFDSLKVRKERRASRKSGGHISGVRIKATDKRLSTFHLTGSLREYMELQLESCLQFTSCSPSGHDMCSALGSTYFWSGDCNM